MKRIAPFINRLFSRFRPRLLALVTLGIIALAVTSAVTTAWMSSARSRAQMIAQGLQITANLAGQSTLALLFGSPENAEKPLEAVIGFPNVESVGIFDAEGAELLVLGESATALPKLVKPVGSMRPSLVHQTPFAWYFVAPVYAGSSSMLLDEEMSPFELSTPPQEFLGFAFVSMNKRALHALNLNIFVNNILIGLSFAMVIVVVLNLAINKLTNPLTVLSSLMRESEEKDTYVFADLNGPQEITDMARVYNRMMASLEERDRRLRQHRAVLQTEVAIRTQELVQARDAALSANRHKSEFLANMSHELRTPLQAIIGYADIIKEDLVMEGKEDSIEDLERIIHNAQRLLNMINNILRLSKVEAGRMEVRLQAVNLRTLAKEAAETVQPLLRKNNNLLEIIVEDEQDILIDREKILQAILNLLSNAGKFTVDGKIALSIHQTSSLLTIKVSDTGIGLTSEQQRIIFEEFRQVDGSYTRKFEGTGLGLTITRRFCELLGGSIQVESEEGRGSTFTIRIPLPIESAVLQSDVKQTQGSQLSFDESLKKKRDPEPLQHL